jgi:ArsR family metal-binding transcriptional regulator
MKIITTFPCQSAFEKTKSFLERLSFPYHIISPEIAYGKVGVSAIIVDQSIRSALYSSENETLSCSGWVDYHPSQIRILQDRPRLFQNDLMGKCSIVVLTPCMADIKKIRLIAHLSGCFTEVFPYPDIEMPQGMYNKEVPIFTFMDAYRMVSLYSKRVTIAKADDLIDAWRLLEKIRILVNNIWVKKDTIQPSYEMRRKPPALEIYKRLPGLSCKECGEKTCTAFALRLWNGEVKPSRCNPIFKGDYRHLKEAFLEICSSLGQLEY